ncbi:MAG: GNAT family N-acetyltransferase [Bacteroidetes bacterium]|nr:GNAT family N-acetyltransferase [Bacteroidota bacterium]
MISDADIKLIKIEESNFLLIGQLAEEAASEGYAFVQRTIDEWETGVNRFSDDGEALLGLMAGTKLIGIGGLNRDTYTEQPNIGRVRHLYIRSAYRRKGYATILMKTIINQAGQHFAMLRLFTDNPEAAVFYETLGFDKADLPKASHTLFLTNLQKLVC